MKDTFHMKLLIKIFSLVFFCITNSYSQELNYLLIDSDTFQTYEEGIKTLRTNDGNFLVMGMTLAGSALIHISKIDPAGNVIWSERIQTLHSIGINPQDVTNTFDGGFIITGHSYNGAATGNIAIIKIDSSGGLQWCKDILSGTGDGGNSVIQLPDSSYIITGSIHNTYTNAFVMRLDKAGNVQWTRIYNSAYNGIKAMNAINGGYSVCMTEGGSFTWILSFDNVDTLISNIRVFTYVPNWYYIFDCLRASDGDYVIIGSFDNSLQKQNMIIKMDNSGIMKWKTVIDVSSNDGAKGITEADDHGFNIVCDTALFYTTAGSDVGKAYILKLDSLGNLQWGNILNDMDKASTILKLDGDTVLITGTRKSVNHGEVHLKTVYGAGNTCGGVTASGIAVNDSVVSTMSFPIISPLIPSSQFIIVSEFINSNILLTGANITDLCNNVSVEEIQIEKEMILISPNPTTSDVNINFSRQMEKVISVDILDISGKIICTMMNNSFDISKLQQGIYMLRVISNRSRFMKRIVKV